MEYFNPIQISLYAIHLFINSFLQPFYTFIKNEFPVFNHFSKSHQFLLL